jgi:hypothetical protein
MRALESTSAVYRDRSPSQVRLLILASAVSVAFLLYWEGHIAHHLFWDEGFLWYGVQRVMHGEVPIRDFMAYDPGRYYWMAAITSLLGDDSISALRFASALFQSIGLFMGLWVITPANIRTSASYILLSAIILVLWMYPSYKVYDTTVSILLIAAFAYLADHPTYRRSFLAGLVLGIGAWIGKNHGAYGVFGGILLIAYLKTTQRELSLLKTTAIWAAGIFIGYLPMLFMLVAVPRFGIDFWEKSVRFLFELRATNLPLPIPWPWLVNFHQQWFDACRDVLVGVTLISLLLYAVFGIVMLVRSVLRADRLLAPFVASAVLALPYAHYTFSRADIYHLPQGTFPLLLGSLAILSRCPTVMRHWGMVIWLIATFWTIFPSHPGWLAQRAGNWPAVTVGTSVLIVDPGTAGAMKSVSELVDVYSPNGRDFLVTPFWPGAYAAFGRKSPTWEIYAWSPRSKTFQEEEIARIRKANPGFILVYDYALDAKEENRFSNTHRIMDQFIRANYTPIETGIPNNPFRIYIPKQPFASTNSTNR